MRHRSPLGSRPRPRNRSAAARVLAAAVATTVLLGGCSLFDGSDEGQGPTPAAPTTTTTLPPTELLAAGAAPRRPLRVVPTAGARTTLALTIDLDIDQEVAGTRQAFDAPAVTETVTLTVGPATTGGRSPVAVRFDAVTLDRTGTDLNDTEAADLTAALQTITGITGSGTIDERGQLTGLRYAYPSTLDPAVRATVDQFQDQLTLATPPLPDEPVGVGGRWLTRTATTLAGVTVDQETTYELTGFDGDTVTYTATVTQGAEDQAVTLQGLPAGATARLVSADLRGTTTGTFSLTSLDATAEAEVRGTQVIDVTGAAADGGPDGSAPDTTGTGATVTTLAPQRLTQRLDLAVTITPGS